MGIAIYKYKINFDFFNNKKEKYWYFIGFIASDGYISDDKIEIALNMKDEYMIKNFRDLICPDKPVYYKPKTNSVRFTIHNKKIAKELKKIFSLTSNKKHDEMKFPKVPKRYLKDFLRGYIDGDGSICKAKGYQVVNGNKKTYIGIRLRILGNYDFLKRMTELIRNEIPNKTFSISKRKNENVYEVTYNFSIAEAILHWIYDDNLICLKRKEEKFIYLLNNKE